MIPKIIHFIWIGDETQRPDHHIQTWIDKHQDYEIKIWGNSSLAEYEWINAQHMDAILDQDLSGVAHMMRWEILFREGGIAPDANSICINRLDDWMLNFPTFACWENEIVKPGIISARYFASEAQNDFLRKIIFDIKEENSITNDSVCRVVGSERLTNSYSRHQYQSLHIFPSYYFIPEHFTGIHYNGAETIYAIQLWNNTKTNRNTTRQIKNIIATNILNTKAKSPNLTQENNISILDALAKALQYHKENNIKKAKNLYLSILKKDKNNYVAKKFLDQLKSTRNNKSSSKINEIEIVINNKNTHLEIKTHQINELIKNNQPLTAIDFLKIIQKLHGNSAEIFYLFGSAYANQKKYEVATSYFEKVFSLESEHIDAIESMGLCLAAQELHKEAIFHFDRAIEIDNKKSRIYTHKGNSLFALNQSDQAIKCFIQASLLDPGNFFIHRNLGHCLRKLRMHERALQAYKRAFKCDPNQSDIMSLIISTKDYACNWENYDEDKLFLKNLILDKKTIESPFAFLNISDNAEDQFTCINTHTIDKYGNKPREYVAKKSKGEKIRIGYLSADYHDHATTHLIEKLFELHDRDKFIVIGLSIAPNKNDSMTTIIKEKFDLFIEYKGKTEEDIATEIKLLEIDILVDLKGHTEDSRPKILAYHPAPVQVNYLGFPGTTGGTLADYIIADYTLIPEGEEIYYTEKVVRLPFSYQINNNDRYIPEYVPERSKINCHLPQDSFVFCCFNNNYKINPKTFSIWMEILSEVPNSVLWLLHDNDDAVKNLHQEARKRLIDPNRIIFAPRLKNVLHMERHYHADLFLDTLPINAHTTARDALWMGLPVLTQIGNGFASRVAASLLKSVELPELITSSDESYKAMAIKLATDRTTLTEMKTKLIKNRLTCDLFNSEQTTLALEQAYQVMHARRQTGQDPAHFDVLPPTFLPEHCSSVSKQLL